MQALSSRTAHFSKLFLIVTAKLNTSKREQFRSLGKNSNLISVEKVQSCENHADGGQIVDLRGRFFLPKW